MPVFDTSPPPFATPARSETATSEPEVTASPVPEIALPENVTGATTSAGICHPVSLPIPEFSIRPPEFATPERSSIATWEPFDAASSNREPALPAAVSGVVTSAGTCHPVLSPIPEFEIVPAPPAVPSASRTSTRESFEDASPKTLAALPAAVSGAVTSPAACQPVPTPMPSFSRALPSPSPPAPVVVTAEPCDSASPNTLTAFPATVTGAETSTSPWAPVSTPSGSFELGASFGCAGACVTDEAVDFAFPVTLTALPDTVTGVETAATAFSPFKTPVTALRSTDTIGAGFGFSAGGS